MRPGPGDVSGSAACGCGKPPVMLKIDKLLLLARELRARAEEVLAQAETMKDADARQKMRAIAASYEKLGPPARKGGWQVIEG